MSTRTHRLNADAAHADKKNLHADKLEHRLEAKCSDLSAVLVLQTHAVRSDKREMSVLFVRSCDEDISGDLQHAQNLFPPPRAHKAPWWPVCSWSYMGGSHVECACEAGSREV
jgi:hypothetical protein